MIDTTNVHQTVWHAAKAFSDDSRVVPAGDGLCIPEPIVFNIQNPLDSVSFWNRRDPFSIFARRFVQLASEIHVGGLHQHGEKLAEGDMQIVLGHAESGRAVYQKDREGLLTCTVFAPAFDVIDEDFGANALTLEFLSTLSGLEVGPLTYISPLACAGGHNLGHVREIFEMVIRGDVDARQHTPHFSKEGLDRFIQELLVFAQEGPAIGMEDPFIRRVASPIVNAQSALIDPEDPDRFERADQIMKDCVSIEWREACQEWIYTLRNNQ